MLLHPELPGIPPAPKKEIKNGRKTASYLVALSRALHRLTLSPQLYILIVTIAREQTISHTKAATIPSLSLSLGCSFQAISLHLRKNSDYFIITHNPHPRPNHITLSRAGAEILQETKKMIKAYSLKP